MSTFDDLKRMFDEGRRKEQVAQGTQRVADEVRRLEGKKLADARTAEEQKYWGTPEQAYQTWESRLRKLVEIEKELTAVFREEHRHAESMHGQLFFGIDDTSSDDSGTTSGPYGHIHLVELTEKRVRYDDSGKFLYEMVWNGQILSSSYSISFTYEERTGKEVYHKTTSGRLVGLSRNNTLSELEQAVVRIFAPKIAADLIERGDSALVKPYAHALFTLGHVLRTTPPDQYSFGCEYPANSKSVTDTLTNLRFGNQPQHIVQIVNPDERAAVRDFLLKDIYIVFGFYKINRFSKSNTLDIKP